MSRSVADALHGVHPRMLRAGSVSDPQILGEQARRVVGRAFEHALDRAGVTKQDAAYRMGYSDSGVMGRWISGIERVQLDKVMLLDEVYPEFLLALLEPLPGVERTTNISYRRVS